MTPEKKKQAESAVRYRVAGHDRAPEKKKQAESAVRYRVAGHDRAPEKKKQAESVVRVHRIPSKCPQKEQVKDLPLRD